jgi:soluble lytic murein transglycosylase-like protein
VEQAPIGRQDLALAAAIYCEAARYGSSEGHYRAGLIHLRGSGEVHDLVAAKSFFTYANQLGHQQAMNLLFELQLQPIVQPACLTQIEAYRKVVAAFDFDRYIQQLPATQRGVASLILRIAPEYGIAPELAMAVAAVESNFDARALSPQNAQGVMQLIPATAERFKVRNAWDPEQNIRGGLAYLRWLHGRFAGDLEKVVAAYNAGEGAVARYGGIPPYYETQSYVFRVLSFARRGKHPISTR